MSILVQFFLLLFLIRQLSGQTFSPTVEDYNAYGLKIAANNLMVVEALNDLTQFLVQFGPYTDDITLAGSRSCSLEYDDPAQFVYTVALGTNQSTYDIFFVGEMLGMSDDDPVGNRTFINILRYDGNLSTIDCGNFEYITNYIPFSLPHQEHLVMTTDPFGLVAYGFSSLFTFSYTANPSNLVAHLNNSLSLSSTFLPFAVDYDGSRGVIAGFTDNGRNSRVKYRATVILFSISATTAIATSLNIWTYPANGTTWQAGDTNAGADQYAAKFDMSVSISPTATQALVGMQSLNTVFLFSYSTSTLTLVNYLDNGRGIGFGKGVAWLNNIPNSFAILANVYSSSYVWSSSKIYVYESALTNTSMPVSIFPSNQQPAYSYLSSVFLNIVTTPSDLVLIDSVGDLFIIRSVPSGYYSSTIGPSVEISPAVSSQLPCIPGTYKNITGIRRCLPCPTGTKNEGTNLNITTCIDCANNAFCPLGSTSDLSTDVLSNFTQALAYPLSPDMTEIDDILFFTLFALGTTGRCLVLSPIFWTLIVGLVAIIIAVLMLILKNFIKSPKASSRYKIMAKIFKQTDVIGEGEMWSGGLATFCILILCIFSYVFSVKYYNQYPIETSDPSTFTCDLEIRNAKFSTQLRSLSVPVAEDFQTMVDLLNNQVVYLTVAFVNTIYNCTSDKVTLAYLFGSTWIPITTLSCNYTGYTLSYSALLPFKTITLRFNLPNIYTIGGLRVGLTGPGQPPTDSSSAETLQDLGFSQTFSQNGRMLGQNANIALILTKVINDTTPLEGKDDTFSGLWISSSSINYFESFMTDTDYLYATPYGATNLTIVISETPYYILNIQEPITKKNELIFHNLLFTSLVIEIFALSFLFVKLFILPLISIAIKKCCPSLAKNSGDGSSTSGRRNSTVSDQYKSEYSPTNFSRLQDAGNNHHFDRHPKNFNEPPRKLPPLLRRNPDGTTTIVDTVKL